MKILVGRDYEHFSKIGAEVAAEFIRENPGKLLCFAAGDTPLGIYKELINLQKLGEVDLNSMYYVGLDEWVGIGYETKGSCKQVMQDGFYSPADISAKNVRVFNGLGNPDSECAEIDHWIEDRGGIALTVLGIGMNGHIGFNEPFTNPELNTIVTALDATTTNVGKKYFDGVQCPEKGMTVGIRRLKEAQEVVLAVSGAKKGPVLRKALIDEPMEAIPASLMQNHANLTVITDKSAFKAL